MLQQRSLLLPLLGAAFAAGGMVDGQRYSLVLCKLSLQLSLLPLC